MRMYNLEFLPSAKKDMVEIIKYISNTLNNPTAADSLAEKMIVAAEKLTEFPYSYPVYMPIRQLNHEYRRLAVNNYIMFYWVNEEEKLITIARVVYSKRNYKELLNDSK